MQDGLVLWLDARAQRQLMKDGQSKSIWKDLSGNGNDGQLMNFDFTEDSGWVDGGLRFDGVNDTVYCGNGESLNITDDLTIEMLVYVPEDGEFGGVVKGSQGTWASNSYGLRSYYGSCRFYITDGNNVSQINIAIPKGKLVSIVGTTSKASNIMKGYKNGMLVSSRERGIEDIQVQQDGLYVGMGYTAALTKGNIFLVRIYNRALTDEEIMQNYQATHFLLEPKTFTSNDYYNYYDLNRVEINTLATKDLTEFLRGDISLENIDFDRNMKAFPFADVLNRVEGNINILGNKLYKPKGWTQPKLDWRYNQPFSYEDANRLEKNLLLLYRYAKGNIDSFKYCGAYTCGEAVV